MLCVAPTKCNSLVKAEV